MKPHRNPHRLFAVVGIALGVFAILFMAISAPIAAREEGLSLFSILAAVMGSAAVSSLVAFPRSEASYTAMFAGGKRAPIPALAWFAVVGISVQGGAGFRFTRSPKGQCG